MVVVAMEMAVLESPEAKKTVAEPDNQDKNINRVDNNQALVQCYYSHCHFCNYNVMSVIKVDICIVVTKRRWLTSRVKQRQLQQQI